MPRKVCLSQFDMSSTGLDTRSGRRPAGRRPLLAQVARPTAARRCYSTSFQKWMLAPSSYAPASAFGVTSAFTKRPMISQLLPLHLPGV